eukprot:4912641-Pyramimonas_sp.AAC.1
MPSDWHERRSPHLIRRRCLRALSGGDRDTCAASEQQGQVIALGGVAEARPAARLAQPVAVDKHEVYLAGVRAVAEEARRLAPAVPSRRRSLQRGQI